MLTEKEVEMDKKQERRKSGELLDRKDRI